MARFDPEREAHKAWLGLLQPVGLVVSAPALMNAQVVLDKNVVTQQQRLLEVVRPGSLDDGPSDTPLLTNFPLFAEALLEWEPADLAGAPEGPPMPAGLEVVLPDYGETLRPDYAVIDRMADNAVLMLVLCLPPGTPLDTPMATSEIGWHASPQARFERLLKDTGVVAGLLLNGETLRLVYAPRGETSGHVGFPIDEMTTVQGRPILSALHMLLCAHRVFGAADGQRLLDLLHESRKYQSEVSNRLSGQVLKALWSLLHGIQAADEAANGRVLCDLPETDPDHIYSGLLTVILRLVFLLYAEDWGMMPDDPTYTANYSVGGLYERLREDAGRHPDTLDQRFGAWAWLLSTFRLIYDGGGHGGMRLPTRHGQLFDPDAFPFLEGRPRHQRHLKGTLLEAPRLSDGVIWRVLEGLLVLDGERLSYRTLDVEQIGSVYESMMGFRLERAQGRAIAVTPKHIVVDVDALLAQELGKRARWLADNAECRLSSAGNAALKRAGTPEAVVAALGRRVSPATPRLLAPGALYLQPGEERRRSGSHYTPRELTGPVVAKALAPALAALGPHPSPERLLELKVCDPAMGSGAFLVETCRQLAKTLEDAWEYHGDVPALPADEELLLHARRLVAQRCLYGVDKNPFAVSLAKLSLWLVTLARDHAFTFLDHALKHGDSLVGLSRQQIASFGWTPDAGIQDLPLLADVRQSVAEASRLRTSLQGLHDNAYDAQDAVWSQSEALLHALRRVGDVLVEAFFAEEKAKGRDKRRQRHRLVVHAWEDGAIGIETVEALANGLRAGDVPVTPFHWELEFPEVFGRQQPGFDVMVGNPPFAGKNTLLNANRSAFLDWLKNLHPGSHGNADLVAHFFRRAFDLLRPGGSFGLIATNTIGQGDTRSTGLRWICTHGGEIYHAQRRLKWPGLAAVVVSVVHVFKGRFAGPRHLDGRAVEQITAFLFHAGGHDNPATLTANAGKSFQGSIVLGMGFTFDDTDKKGKASTLADMARLIAQDPRNAERILPYIGGQEVNTSPTHAHHRFVINFSTMTEAEARRWPDLMAVVEERVKPERMRQKREIRKRYWWRFGETTPALFRAIEGLERVLVIARVGQHAAFARLRAGTVFSEQLIVMPLDGGAAFCTLQSQPHETWARFFGSSLEDRLRYTPSDCFETFPFPDGWEDDPTLEAVGEAYDTFRAALMVRNNEGLTKTYNRFHDPGERHPDILELRRLHAALDRAVLDAYGWQDIPTDCDFLLDYEIDAERWGSKKKPYRCRWPAAVHDEVLARLMALNQTRAEAEAVDAASGPHKTLPRPRRRPLNTINPRRDRAGRPQDTASAGPLFDVLAQKERS